MKSKNRWVCGQCGWQDKTTTDRALPSVSVCPQCHSSNLRLASQLPLGLRLWRAFSRRS